MDPASAIIGIVSFGFTVFGKVNEMRKAYKNAPEQVQALYMLCQSLKLLLDQLNTIQRNTVPCLPDTLMHLQSLVLSDAEARLQEVNAIIDKVAPSSPANRQPALPLTLSKKAWMKNKGDLEDAQKKLGQLHAALTAMADVMTLSQLHPNNHQENANIIPVNRRIENTPSPTLDATPSPTLDATPFTERRRPLRCPDKCACRCHVPVLISLIPRLLAPYLGQVYVSRQLLNFIPYLYSNQCDVDKCRGDFRSTARISWFLYLWILNGKLQLPLANERIHFSLYATRLLPQGAPLRRAIGAGDLSSVRDLFREGCASVWDCDEVGRPMFWHACYLWAHNHYDHYYDVIEYLVDAGAKDVMFEEVYDTLVEALFQYLLDDPMPGRSVANALRTNEVTTRFFRKIVGEQDIKDAVQDYLERHVGSETYVQNLLVLLESASSVEAMDPIFQAIGYESALQYGIMLRPSRGEILMWRNPDLFATRPVVAWVCAARRSYLISDFVQGPGVDVNMTFEGLTALQWACRRSYFHELLELVRCAGDALDWTVRTKEGRNVLDLFELGVSEGWAYQYNNDVISSIRSVLTKLKERMGNDDSDSDLDMPGAFP